MTNVTFWCSVVSVICVDIERGILMHDLGYALEGSEASIFLRANELKKRNIEVDGRRTSVTLEPQVWVVLHDVAQDMNMDVHGLCSFINRRKGTQSSLASAIRVFLISYLNIKHKKIRSI